MHSCWAHLLIGDVLLLLALLLIGAFNEHLSPQAPLFLAARAPASGAEFADRPQNCSLARRLLGRALSVYLLLSCS